MKVLDLRGDAQDAGRWQAWTRARPAALAELWPWGEVVGHTYGLPQHRLVAVDGAGSWRGSLVLFEVRHPLFGHFLTTAAYLSAGGLHAPEPDVRDLLLREAKALCHRVGASHLCIRCDGLPLDGFVHTHHYVGAHVELAGGRERLWRGLPAKTRNQVRRGQREGFTVRSEPHGDSAFAELFHEHMRALGSPAHGPLYFAAIARCFGPAARFTLVRDRGTVVAGAVTLRLGDTVFNMHAVSLRAYNRRNPNSLLYWSLIEDAADAGAALLDLGRSLVDSGNLRFKKSWRPVLSPLCYNFHLRGRPSPPFTDPRNRRYRLPIAAWRHMPRELTRALGPRLMRGLA